MSTGIKTVNVTTLEGDVIPVTVFDLRYQSLDGRPGWHACPPLSSTQPAYATPQDAALAHARNCGHHGYEAGIAHDVVCEVIQDILDAERAYETMPEADRLRAENTRLLLVNTALAEWSTFLLLAATQPDTARASVDAATFCEELKALGYTEADGLWRHRDAALSSATLAQTVTITVSDESPTENLGAVAAATGINPVVLLTRLTVRGLKADRAARLASEV
jgi:hypothetical protein